MCWCHSSAALPSWTEWFSHWFDIKVDSNPLQFSKSERIIKIGSTCDVLLKKISSWDQLIYRTTFLLDMRPDSFWFWAWHLLIGRPNEGRGLFLISSSNSSNQNHEEEGPSYSSQSEGRNSSSSAALLRQPRIGRPMCSILFWFHFYSERMKGRYIDTTRVINWVFEEQENSTVRSSVCSNSRNKGEAVSVFALLSSKSAD